MRHNNFFFGRPPEQPKPPVVIPQFEIRCQCGSPQVRASDEASDEEGAKVYLFCATCRARDELKVR